MKKLYKIFFIAVLFVLLYSCEDTHGPSIIDSLYRVKVDSIVFPLNPVFSHDTLVIKLLGTIGTDTCHSFSHFQGSNSTLRTDLVVWARENSVYGETCTSRVIPLDKQFRIFPVSAGTYLVVIHQPGGSTLEREILVRP